MKNLFFLILFSCIATITSAQYIYTVAGNSSGGNGADNCLATNAGLTNIASAAVGDLAGNLYVADYGDQKIRKIDTNGIISTIAGTGFSGYNGDNILAVNAQLRQPMAVALDNSGNLLIADYGNYRIRKLDLSTGIITTVAGSGIWGYNGDSLSLFSANLSDVTSLAVDSAGNIVIAEVANNIIRKIDFGTGLVYTIVGTKGTAGYNGDGILAKNALLNYSQGVNISSNGDIFIADEGNHRVRKIDHTTGIISTVAGNGISGYNGDGILADSATLYHPVSISFDTLGDVYIADSWNNRIRKVDSSGVISTIAGITISGYSGDGGLATLAQMSTPKGVFVDKLNRVFISDYYNHRIRMVTDYNDTSAVWPGDTDNNNIVDNSDLFLIGMYYYKNGPLRNLISNTWQADSSANWSINDHTGNIKHIDSDGSGFIDLSDTLAISMNFSSAHAYAPLNTFERASDPYLYFITNNTSYTAGSIVDVEVWLGTSGTPVSNLYGISFDLSYNTNLVQPGSANISYPSSWFGTIGNDAIKISKINEIAGIAYGAIVKTTSNSNGFGKIADFKFQVNSNVQYIDSLHVTALAYKGIDVGSQPKTFNVIPLGSQVPTGISNENFNYVISIFPNPSNGIYNLILPQSNEKKTISVFNVIGKKVYNITITSNDATIDLSNQPSGVYLLKVLTSSNYFAKKIIKN